MEVAPYISTAEMVQKLQFRIREIVLPRNRSFSKDTFTSIQMKTKLTLTRPKEPKLETAQRVRALRIKSSAEIEEEMLAKLPKFKACPFNKKTLKASSLPMLPRRTSQPPDFHVTNRFSSYMSYCKPLKLSESRPPILETSLKAQTTKHEFFILEQRKEVAPYISIAEMVQKFQFRIREIELPQNRSFSKDTFTRPKEPKLEAAQRVRAIRIKSSTELEEEMLAKLPKFKARPFKKKILEVSALPPKPLPKQSTKQKAFHLDSLIRHEKEMNKIREERERMERVEAERRIFIAQPIMKEDPIPLLKRKRKPLTDVQEFVLHVDHRAVKRSEFGEKMKEKKLTDKRITEQENLKMD